MEVVLTIRFQLRNGNCFPIQNNTAINFDTSLLHDCPLSISILPGGSLDLLYGMFIIVILLAISSVVGYCFSNYDENYVLLT